MSRDNFGVVQGADGFHFALEADNRGGMLYPARSQNLHRHDAFELVVHGSVHGAHAALPQLGRDLIRPDAFQPAAVRIRRVGLERRTIRSPTDLFRQLNGPPAVALILKGIDRRGLTEVGEQGVELRSERHERRLLLRGQGVAGVSAFASGQLRQNSLAVTRRRIHAQRSVRCLKAARSATLLLAMRERNAKNAVAGKRLHTMHLGPRDLIVQPT
jgi:hypothetical protein